MLKRVVIPDSHGSYIDKVAATAFLRDLKKLKPQEVVFLGDHVDASGMFSRYPSQFMSDHYEYKGDIDAAKNFVSSVRKSAPMATMYYLEGNHEHHVERWVASTFKSPTDAESAFEAFAPDVRLGLKGHGISYLRRSDVAKGMSTRGVLRLEGCDFVHGISAATWATGKHLDVFGSNVAHGHTHRAVMLTRRRPDGTLITAQCPGTLAQLSPLYMHTSVTNWSHGYGLQFVERNKLWAYNVPIVEGRTVLP